MMLRRQDWITGYQQKEGAALFMLDLAPHKENIGNVSRAKK